MIRSTRRPVLLAVLAFAAVPLLASGRQTVPKPIVDAEHLRAAHARVAASIRTLPGRFSLAQLLHRSMVTSDPTDLASLANSNRATLLVIACSVNGWSLGGLVPEARNWPRLPLRNLALRGRHDLAQHFVAAASLSATAGSPVADAIAMLKEIRDTTRGSGFSFSDVAANRAGSLFGQLASGSPASASRLLARLAGPIADEDIMPATSGLPDNLSDREFARRIGGVGSPMYNALVSDIDRRIAALDIYRASTN